MTSTIISRAGADDGNQISDIIRSSFQRQAQLLGISENEFPNYVAFESAASASSRIAGTQVYLMKLDEQPLGTIGLYATGGTGYIERLAVLPASRGRGYGEQLLYFAENELLQLGCSVVQVSIVAEFTRLKSYYERQGFQETLRRNYSSLPFEVLFLEKPLC
ncbi:GNAT family N-acetyltransferase [Paenibacillus tengchongensis]|uniref:GNAT family N-acetyltransferase n=1 Tax=Paenibacillus tengchongensis TaxID=2608684 RepID=UPI00165224ED|nr:GNAT family N-acetyltransferase [Paenibacillus tengchongensis]